MASNDSQDGPVSLFNVASMKTTLQHYLNAYERLPIEVLLRLYDADIPTVRAALAEMEEEGRLSITSPCSSYQTTASPPANTKVWVAMCHGVLLGVFHDREDADALAWWFGKDTSVQEGVTDAATKGLQVVLEVEQTLSDNWHACPLCSTELHGSGGEA